MEKFSGLWLCVGLRERSRQGFRRASSKQVAGLRLCIGVNERSGQGSGLGFAT